MAVEWQLVLVLRGPSAQPWAGSRNSCWAQVNSLSFADLRAIGVGEPGRNAGLFPDLFLGPSWPFCKGQPGTRSVLPVAMSGYGVSWHQERSHSTHEGEKRGQKGPISWEKGGTECNIEERAGCQSHKDWE